MNRWTIYSKTLIAECRLVLLRKEYTNKVFLTQAFNSFKQEIWLKKRCKYRAKFTALKAWQSHLAYKKYMYQAGTLVFKSMAQK